MQKSITPKKIKAYQDRIDEIINNHGHAVQAVFSNNEDEENFAYTIGLAPTRGYELVCVVNVSPSTMHYVLNDVAKILEHKPPQENLILEEILVNYPIKLTLACGTDVYDDYVIGAVRRYGREFKVWQVLIPDRDSVFPDEPGYNHSGMPQPML